MNILNLIRSFRTSTARSRRAVRRAVVRLESSHPPSDTAAHALPGLAPHLRVFLLRPRERFVRQQNRLVDGHGETAMAAAEHDGDQDELAARMPGATEGVRVPRDAGRDADAAVAGDDCRGGVSAIHDVASRTRGDGVGEHTFENDVEGREDDRIALELARLDHGDEQHRERDPPQIVPELAAQLLPEEVLPLPHLVARLRGGGGHHALEAADEAALRFRRLLVVGRRVLGEDAQAALFVHVRVADGHGDGQRRHVHHQHVQDQQAGAQAGDVDDVEAAAADGEGLEEPVEDAVVRRDGVGDGVADVEDLKADPVGAVEDDERHHEPPRLLRGEEVRVDAARVVEDEGQYPPAFLPCCAFAVGWTELFHAPEGESEEGGEGSVAC